MSSTISNATSRLCAGSILRAQPGDSEQASVAADVNLLIEFGLPFNTPAASTVRVTRPCESCACGIEEGRLGGIRSAPRADLAVLLDALVNISTVLGCRVKVNLEAA